MLDLTVNIDKVKMEQICRQQIAERIKEFDADLVFWDSAELRRRTCMSWSTIQATFFFDPRFPKRKVRGKWYYPAQETRAFLEQWLAEY
ncbi:group-specific protein [Paenibacillus sp. DMB5]|uniref:group-specific protein n=1 Tax=Paenibacillus sp. DMB5 TaxID=1780103 RepID=UPI00076D4FE1|nr:group-specific protein [Paenibacillus sp. DMB5]KUP23129.1 group-specific protein [Paenibacillus sp. DMB5]